MASCIVQKADVGANEAAPSQTDEPSLDGWPDWELIKLAERHLFTSVGAVAGHAPLAIAAQTAYDAVFVGDASGATDVTDTLRTFLESHDGQHVALSGNAVYAVTQLSFTAHDLTVDFRGARIQGVEVGARGILRIQSSSNIVLNDATVHGTGYAWDPAYQWEHGIQIDGGSSITINHPTTRDTRGDGIYVGYQAEEDDPPTGVVINRPNIERASRNGIAPVAGEVTIMGGHIDRVGLHGIDFEPNDDRGAASIRGVVDGVDIRRHGDLPTGHPSYAVAAAGHIRTPKHSLRITNLTGDLLRMNIRHTASVIVCNNVSRRRTKADFLGATFVMFSGNIRIRRR